MSYYIVRLDTKEILDERTEKPTAAEALKLKKVQKTGILVIEGIEVINTEDQEGLEEKTPTASDTIQVRATKKIALAKVVKHDKSCKGQQPPGKPVLEPPKFQKGERVVIPKGDVFKVKAQAAYSCKDDPSTPEILATGNKPYYIVAEGHPGAGQFCRKDKTVLEGS